MRLLPISIALITGCGSTGGFRSDAGPGDGNDQNGPFREQRIDESIIHGQGVEAVDIDGDGDQDVVAALSLTDGVYLYRNESAGTRWTTIRITDGDIVGMEVEVVDLDGDGDLDVAAVGLFDRAVGFESPGEVAWFENPGDVTGTWTRHDITGLTFWAPIYVEAEDLTGNGSPDLVVGAIDINGNGNGVHWFRNTGGGTFEGPMAIDADLNHVTAVQLHDVDGDGVFDVLAAGRGSSEIVWYENGRDAATTEPDPPFARHILAETDQPNDIQLADMDDDPELEVVATLTRGAGAVVYFDSGEVLTEPWAEVSITEDFGAGESARLAIADFDGDQDNDVAANTFEPGELRVYTQDGDSFAERIVRGEYRGLNFITSADIDGDGRVDLVTSTYGNADASDIIAWWANRP